MYKKLEKQPIVQSMSCNVIRAAIVVAALLATSLSASSGVALSSSEANKYQIMSVYMYNFFRYITWPIGLETDEAGPITLCTIGNDPFENALNKIKDKRPHGKPITIRRHIALQQAEQCTLIYISKSEEKKLGYILSTIGQYPILTISEIDNFIRKGGMVEFSMAKGNLSFSINNQEIKKSGLVARVVLLEIADEVIK